MPSGVNIKLSLTDAYQPEAALQRPLCAESLELRLLNAETTLKLMADRISKADDKTKREIVLALVDRITIETIRDEKDVRTTAKVRYAFDPPPIERYTQRQHLRYPEFLSPVPTVVDYLTCA